MPIVNITSQEKLEPTARPGVLVKNKENSEIYVVIDTFGDKILLYNLDEHTNFRSTPEGFKKDFIFFDGIVSIKSNHPGDFTIIE